MYTGGKTIIYVSSIVVHPSSKLPRHKTEIAERLARGALSVAYEQEDVIASGPFPSRYAAFPSNQSLVLALDGSALEARSVLGFEVCG